MPKCIIVYSKDFYTSVERFMASFVGIYEKLYDDTGIEDENLIIDLYIQHVSKLKKDLLSQIQKIFARDQVIGRRQVDTGGFQVFIPVGNFLVDIHFLDNQGENTRVISKAYFYKK